MKRKFFYFVMMLFALTMMGCSDDDKGIYFTEDEAQGDILTGKQVGIKDNTLNVYTTEQNSVNVQGASGKISATSDDEGIAKVVACDNTDEKRVHVLGVSVGKTKITVTDEKGNSAQFIVNVDDVENAWSGETPIEVIDVKCRVDGVSKEDSAAIASEAIAQNKYKYFLIQSRSYEPFHIRRLKIMDEQKNVLVEGLFYGERDSSLGITTYYVREYKGETILESFIINPSRYFIFDRTKQYKERYPSVKRVLLGLEVPAQPRC